MKIGMDSIGFVENDITEKKDIDWGGDISRIILNPEFEAGLTGLAEFSHILVVYYLHEAKYDESKHIIRRPQGRDDMPMVGIFSQRAKDRPNPIGITAVELLQITRNVITVKGLDAINNTPVLDIKPYFPIYDSKNNARVPQWVNELMQNYF